MTLSRLRDLAKILDVSLLTLIGEENMYFNQNNNEQGVSAATKLVLNQANIPSEQNELFKGMQNEIIFFAGVGVEITKMSCSEV